MAKTIQNRRILSKSARSKKSLTSKMIKGKSAKSAVKTRTYKKAATASKKAQKLSIHAHVDKNKVFEKMGFATRAIHTGNKPEPLWIGPIPAIDMSTTCFRTSPG